MSWTTLRYLFKEGIVGLWKNRTMALASAGTIVLCLIILGMSYAVGANIDSLLHQIESKFGITCYIEDEIALERQAEIQKEIEAMNGVTEVQYISKEDALTSFAGQMQEEEKTEEENSAQTTAIFEDFKNDNPLPASFEISTDNIEVQEQVVASLNRIPELEVQYLKQETDMFIKINQTINYVCLGIIVCLVVVGLLLMSNTIKLTIYVRRREINIMKYIGATDWFIRLPFLIEGTLIGIIGALIAIGIITSIYDYANERLTVSLVNVLQGMSFVSTQEIMMNMIPVCIALGAFIGLVGSALSLRKHLQV